MKTKMECVPLLSKNVRILMLMQFVSMVLSGTAEVPRVSIPELGAIEGVTKTSYKGNPFYAFEGIPYARPPIGKHRFKAPVEIKPWTGIWQAKTIFKCQQNFHYTPKGEDPVIGTEDCLYLNIYTPNLNGTNLEVLVYIHGGAFMFLQGGFQGPDYILDKNLVYVSINYRLGPLGFLSTENDLIPGNMGLKDQIMALQWIQKYIHNFGGNSRSVTIFGMSAGGASIHFHYFCPKSHNLFHRGISQSGTLLNAWTIQEKPLEKAKRLASSLGCGTTNLREMVECLRKRPSHQIVQNVKIFQPYLYNPFSPFGPVVDHWSKDAVLPQHPITLIKQKKIANVPWIVSHTNSEGLYPGADFYQDLSKIDQNWNELVPHILDYNYTIDRENMDEVSQKIRRHYLGQQVLSKSNFLQFVKILSDRLFLVDIEKTVKLQASVMKAPIFFYEFGYRGAHSKSEGRTGTNINFGAAHGDDTSYVFKTTLNTSSTEMDRKIIELMTEMVASFAKTGKPNVGLEWPAVDSTDSALKHLKISSATELTVEYSDLNSTNFWNSLPFKENEKLFIQAKDEL